jgi:molecular chaperone GrpE
MPDDEINELPVEVDVETTAETAAPPAAAEPAAGPEAGDGAAAVPEGPSLADRLASAEKDKKETYDRLLRTAADFDNFRKRTRKEIEDNRLKAREEVLKEILPGIDNLERALAVSQDAAPAAATASNVLDGVKLVLRQFQSALERFEVKGFNSVGQPFDPGRHEAISQVETASQPPGTVATEMQRGYTIGNRLLRPALVAVAKAPPALVAEPVPEPGTPRPAEATAAEAPAAPAPEPPSPEPEG